VDRGAALPPGPEDAGAGAGAVVDDSDGEGDTAATDDQLAEVCGVRGVVRYSAAGAPRIKGLELGTEVAGLALHCVQAWSEQQRGGGDRVGREERAGVVAQAVSAGLLAGHTMLGSNCDTCLTAMLQDGAGRVYCAGCEALARARARQEQQHQQAGPMQIDAHEHEPAMPEIDAQPEAKKPRLDVDGDGSDAGGPGPFTEVRRPRCGATARLRLNMVRGL
jgi:uncharacterized Zn finger protein (UPF0148 family)